MFHKLKISQISIAALPLTTMLEKAHLGAASRGRKRKREGMEKQREGRNDEKGLQCPEFLTWKVGNPTSNMPS